MNIGIDFGTSFSCIAVKGQVELAPGYGGGYYLENLDVTILPSATGNDMIPSAMWWHPDEPDRYVFGDEAKQMAEEGKSPILHFKRWLGTTEKLTLSGRAVTAKEVTTLFLRHLKEWAETVTGQRVNRVVITHPAYFTPNQRQEILEAGQEAGLNLSPEQLLMDPCAAVMAYLANDQRDPLRLMIYDLGGGTFDVAVIEKMEGVVQIRAINGDHLLGGYNFDGVLAQWILDQLKAKSKTIPFDDNNEEHRGRRARMLQVAEAVKIRLSEQKTDSVFCPVQLDFLVDDQGQRVQFRGQINREQFAALIMPELQKTIACCWAALESAGGGIEVEVDENGKKRVKGLDAILLVGGSTNGKWVKDAVAAEFGEVGETYHPGLCVAAGAAIYAAQLPREATVNARLTLSLDYPVKSVLPVVNIVGRVSPSSGSDLTAEAFCRLQIYLDAPDGSVVGPAEIRGDGQFAFTQVALLDDGSPSVFTVRVSENGREILRKVGAIVYEEILAGVPPLLAGVAPRSLFLKTDRMVPITQAGTPLPAKCQIKLRRVFTGPRLDIPIYMDDEQVGMISVEDIPDEAGVGCMFVVDVEVSANNEMRGNVLVYAPDGRTVLKEGPVCIAFPPVTIPVMAELLQMFDELRDRWENQVLLRPAQDRGRLAGPEALLIKLIKKITEEQAPDRQVLHERVKELECFVNHYHTDLELPRKDFDALISKNETVDEANALQLARIVNFLGRCGAIDGCGTKGILPTEISAALDVDFNQCLNLIGSHCENRCLHRDRNTDLFVDCGECSFILNRRAHQLYDKFRSTGFICGHRQQIIEMCTPFARDP